LVIKKAIPEKKTKRNVLGKKKSDLVPQPMGTRLGINKGEDWRKRMKGKKTNVQQAP